IFEQTVRSQNDTEVPNMGQYFKTNNSHTVGPVQIYKTNHNEKRISVQEQSYYNTVHPTKYSIRGNTYNVGTSYYHLDKIADNVVSALHRLSNEEVAIKKLELDLSGSELDKLKFWKNAYKEMKILNTLNHNNIIKLRDVILRDDLNEIYLVQDLMGHDLSKIKHKLTIDNIKHYMYKILKGIKYMHSRNVSKYEKTPVEKTGTPIKN
ncbi:unnamed protein product, partial [Didymodactylos carnosus]